MESDKDLTHKFLQAIDADTPVTKLWKFRSFIQFYPKEAQNIKDRMLEVALRYKLIGEYELIYKLLGVSTSNIARDGAYGKLKDEILPLINNIKVQASNYQQVGKVEEEVKAYLKLADLLALYGDHKQSELYYSKIIRRQTPQPVVKDEQLLPAWGRQIFFSIDDPQGTFSTKQRRDYSELQIFAIRDLADKKKVNATLALLKDIYKLTRKGRGKGRVRIFQNLKAEHLSTVNVLNNGILSLLDIGFLYSILALANLERETLKHDIKWSSKLQILYLQGEYKKLIKDIHRAYNSFGKFNPTIRFVFDECITQITKRIFLEIFGVYQTISLEKIENMTGFRAATVQIFLRENPQIPYLFDPITQSIVSYQKNVPLYEEAATFFRVIKEKFNEKEKLLMSENPNEGRELRKRPSHGNQPRGSRLGDRMFI